MCVCVCVHMTYRVYTVYNVQLCVMCDGAHVIHMNDQQTAICAHFFLFLSLFHV